jgi:hypothetical protein
MDASTYGRMVERGGYATGGIVLVGERGPELTRLPAGCTVSSMADAQFALMMDALPAAPRTVDPDDGAAGVLARR